MLKRTNRAEAPGMVRSCIIIPECMTFERCLRDCWSVDGRVEETCGPSICGMTSLANTGLDRRDLKRIRCRDEYACDSGCVTLHIEQEHSFIWEDR